jgi:hypothetical protein
MSQDDGPRGAPNETVGDRDAGGTDGDQRVTDDHLLYAGTGLTYLVAATHLFHPEHGFPRLVELAVLGRPSLLVSGPRPVAFVASAVLLIVGANLVLANRWRRPLYLLGMGMVGAYLLGYFAWHFTGHGGFLPGREPIFHGLSPLENVLSHLTVDLLAAVSKVLEAALLVVLGLLYTREEP